MLSLLNVSSLFSCKRGISKHFSFKLLTKFNMLKLKMQVKNIEFKHVRKQKQETETSMKFK